MDINERRHVTSDFDDDKLWKLKQLVAIIVNRIYDRLISIGDIRISNREQIKESLFIQIENQINSILQGTVDLESYPLLLNTVDNFKNNITEFICDVFSKLESDLLFVNKLAGSDVLSEIRLFVGDFHAKNHFVVSFGFIDADSTLRYVYYKPKSLANEIFWNSFLNFCQSLGLKKTSTDTVNIERYDYGWQLGVSHSPLSDKSKAGEFFFNQGVNTALAFVLNVQDLVADNIIAYGTLPAFYDLEMMFVPTITKGKDYQTKYRGAYYDSQSCIKTGMLPEYGIENPNGIGYSDSGVSRVPESSYVNRGKLTHCETNSSDANLPYHDTTVYLIDDFCDCFEAGFVSGCNFIVDNKRAVTDFLKSRHNEISGIKTRILIRLTYIYSDLLNESYPFLRMSTPAEYNKSLETLWKGYDNVYIQPKIIQSEIEQLKKNDIPLFYSFANSGDIYDAYGNLIYENYFDKSGYNLVLEKIEQLNSREIEEQVNIIRRSLSVHTADGNA